jgi:Na+-driven multidrug efflux pump
MISFKFTVIINAFFISLAGYYRIDTPENTTSIIKGIGLGNIVLNILCFAESQGVNGALETLVSQAFGASLNQKETEKFRE